MKKSLYILLLLLACFQLNAQVAENLQQLGMENIRVQILGKNTLVAFENRIYRGTYRGIGEGVKTILDRIGEGRVEIVILDNNIPQLQIILPERLVEKYKSGTINIIDVYREMEITTNTQATMDKFKKRTKVANSSFGKIDVVLYPEFMFENSGFSRLYTYSVNISPAVEVALWKGAELTTQAVIPVATNLSGQYTKIRPGILTIAQEFYVENRLRGRIAGGNFTHNRMGAQGELTWQSKNGRLQFGAQAGSTVQSILTDDEGWYISQNQRFNGSLSASMYEPLHNLKFDLQIARYIYGDYGVRCDLTRYFGENAIGFYGLYVEGELNAGFHFSVPLFGKKWRKNNGIRIRQADFFDMQYSMVSWGDYIDKNLGKTYDTRPNENRSSHFYQPDYIRYFLIKEENKK